MNANEVIDNKATKKTEIKIVSWSDLIEQNRLGKLYSVAEQIVLIAVEWGIEPRQIDEQLIKPLSALVESACKDLLDSSNKE